MRRRRCVVVASDSVPRANSISEFSLWTRDLEINGILQACEELGVSVVPFSPLGCAFLAGGIGDAAKYPSDEFRSTLPRFQQENLKQNLSLLKRSKPLPLRRARPVARLRWHGCWPARIVSSPYGNEAGELSAGEQGNMGALDVKLTAEDLASLDELFPLGVAQGERYGPPGRKMVHM